MKYQSQHDLIDPDFPAPDTALESERDHVSETSDDAYVIGDRGSPISFVDVPAVKPKRKGVERWLRHAAIASAAICAVLTLWNVTRLSEGPPPPPKPTPFQSKQALYLGVMKVDAFRRVHGVTPETLAEVGLPDDGAYAYKRVNPTRYVLSFSASGAKIEYDSTEPKDRFFGSPKDMLTIGGSQ